MDFVGANLLENGNCMFRVWAPLHEQMLLHITKPTDAIHSMNKNGEYFELTLESVSPGLQYFFMPNGEKDYPDPASHYQPGGVHAASEIVNHHVFEWTDIGWHGQPQESLIFYELHVGTFTDEGTFAAIIPRLPALAELGVNAIELMPITQFPGSRNWGYDGVYPYAAQNSYGGPEGFKQLVDACHAHGISVLLDVVYNHIGPEGNYFSAFGPYFTDTYKLPWGQALNFDGDYSDGVRDYFIGQALHWFNHYHVDGLRLDAIHMVFDNGATHFWQNFTEAVRAAEKKAGRPLHLIAESDLNSPRTILPKSSGGYGFNAQWLDDFHHALYVLLFPPAKALYADFGRLDQLAKAYSDGFVLSGEYVQFRKRRYGSSSAGIPGQHFVVFNQNHDQIGNQVKAQRLSTEVCFERLQIAAACTILSPYLPMLFMGEEYGEESPFAFFTNHSDPDLIKGVQEGRKKEFEKFNWKEEPADPQDEKTFLNSKLKWNTREDAHHGKLLSWYRELISLRLSEAALKSFNKNDLRANVFGDALLYLVRQEPNGQAQALLIFNFSTSQIQFPVPSQSVQWHKKLDSYQFPVHTDEYNILAPVIINAGENMNVGPLQTIIYTNTASV